MKDVQNTQDTRNVDIQKVGIKHIELPLTIQRKNKSDKVVYATARVCVSLPRAYKGTHMSRFVEVLNEWRTNHLLGVDIKGCLEKIIKKLHAQSGELEFNFKYFIDKESPVTTLCPCSKEISEYGAHNQRAMISVKISYKESEHIWIEDLIELIESCASCPLHPLLKRQDEKFVTERAYENPKFVEDILRDVVVKLRNLKAVKSFEVDCEAFESIHNHSAWAYQSESLSDGV